MSVHHITCPHCDYEDERLYESIMRHGPDAYELYPACRGCGKEFRIGVSIELEVTKHTISHLLAAGAGPEGGRDQ